MITNLFAELPAQAVNAEQLTAILSRPGLGIERIVSFGQASPPGFWYDQPQGEWVLVLAGAAHLRFEDEPAARTLAVGDCLDIAPHRRHRVEWTSPDAPTVWLVVHYDPGSPLHTPPARHLSLLANGPVGPLSGRTSSRRSSGCGGKLLAKPCSLFFRDREKPTNRNEKQIKPA